jgi:group II intron reverse transcriptase/maturase
MEGRYSYLVKFREQHPKDKFWSLIDKVADMENLKESWQAVKANRGSAGVDNVTLEGFESKLDMNLRELHRTLLTGTYKPNPVKRVWIPKADGRKRGLGIPTVRDRVAQQACKNVIEPIFEMKFRPCSYGYRPNRSAIQALDRISGRYYRTVLDGDITGCFDNIQHERLMELVYKEIVDGKVLNLIRMWLKSGVMEGGIVQETDKGTPQGGVISPLLCNIYLHEFDVEMERKGHELIRYADDFVVLCEDEDELEKAYKDAEHALENIGLKLNKDKTKKTAFWKGFEFLGYRFRKQYRRPTDENVRAFKDRIRSLTVRHWTNIPIQKTIRGVNAVVIGWGNYFKHGTVGILFYNLDCWISMRIRACIEKRKSRLSNFRISVRKLRKLGLQSLVPICTPEHKHTIIVPL